MKRLIAIHHKDASSEVARQAAVDTFSSLAKSQNLHLLSMNGEVEYQIAGGETY